MVKGEGKTATGPLYPFYFESLVLSIPRALSMYSVSGGYEGAIPYIHCNSHVDQSECFLSGEGLNAS